MRLINFYCKIKNGTKNKKFAPKKFKNELEIIKFCTF